MINYVVVRVKATKRNNVVLFILAREKPFEELVKNKYLPGHSLEILREFCKPRSWYSLGDLRRDAASSKWDLF